MISRGHLWNLDDLDVAIALDRDTPVGAVTWCYRPEETEMMSLDAIHPGQGIGSALLRHLEVELLNEDCSRLLVITSNDNLDALAFYQKRGFRITKVYPGAVDAARRLKPSIPAVAENGIHIRDEILLTKFLGDRAPKDAPARNSTDLVVPAPSSRPPSHLKTHESNLR